LLTGRNDQQRKAFSGKAHPERPAMNADARSETAAHQKLAAASEAVEEAQDKVAETQDKVQDTQDKVAATQQKVAGTQVKLKDSADRRTELAAARTVLADERTYAAWVRTGLGAMASGIGAKGLLSGVIPNWMIIGTGTVLELFAAFCFAAAVWRQWRPAPEPLQGDAPRIPPYLLVWVNAFLVLVALTALAGIWVGRG
jgi:putative membrane protein